MPVKAESMTSPVVMLYADTEFTDFINTDLISVALVSACGSSEFYGELTDYAKADESDFVKANVLPLLTKTPMVVSDKTQFIKGTRKEVAVQLLEYLEAVDRANPDNLFIHICVDYSTDFTLIMDLLYVIQDAFYGTRVNTLLSKLRGQLIAEDLSRISNAQSDAVLRTIQACRIVDNKDLAHHALIDARCNRNIHRLGFDHA